METFNIKNLVRLLERGNVSRDELMVNIDKIQFKSFVCNETSPKIQTDEKSKVIYKTILIPEDKTFKNDVVNDDDDDPEVVIKVTSLEDCLGSSNGSNTRYESPKAKEIPQKIASISPLQYARNAYRNSGNHVIGDDKFARTMENYIQTKESEMKALEAIRRKLNKCIPSNNPIMLKKSDCPAPKNKISMGFSPKVTKIHNDFKNETENCNHNRNQLVIKTVKDLNIRNKTESINLPSRRSYSKKSNRVFNKVPYKKDSTNDIYSRNPNINCNKNKKNLIIESATYKSITATKRKIARENVLDANMNLQKKNIEVKETPKSNKKVIILDSQKYNKTNYNKKKLVSMNVNKNNNYQPKVNLDTGNIKQLIQAKTTVKTQEIIKNLHKEISACIEIVKSGSLSPREVKKGSFIEQFQVETFNQH